MTSIVGVLCDDGVVIGSDRSVTFGTVSFRTIEQATRKTRIVGKKVIIATTGSVGLSQRFCAGCAGLVIVEWVPCRTTHYQFSSNVVGHESTQQA